MSLAPATAGSSRRAEPSDAATLTDLEGESGLGLRCRLPGGLPRRADGRSGQHPAAPTRLIEAGGHVLGFYQLRLDGARAEVLMIFVAPEVLGAGLGCRLWGHLEDTARAAGAACLEVDSDPHAEGFYRAMGMRRVGEAPSGSIAGRMLPHLAKELAPGDHGMLRTMAMRR